MCCPSRICCLCLCVVLVVIAVGFLFGFNVFHFGFHKLKQSLHVCDSGYCGSRPMLRSGAPPP
ncbi:hypothetical protein M569_02348, partial [Genlisea aurea]